MRGSSPGFRVVRIFLDRLFELRERERGRIEVALGIAYRRRPGLHRRFMILGFIASLSPATSRILRMTDLQAHRDLLIPLCAALFIAACLVHDWRKHRVVHPVYVVGGLAIIASWPLRLMVGHSDWYFPIGEQVAQVARSIFGS